MSHDLGVYYSSQGIAKMQSHSIYVKIRCRNCGYRMDVYLKMQTMILHFEFFPFSHGADAKYMRIVHCAEINFQPKYQEEVSTAPDQLKISKETSYSDLKCFPVKKNVIQLN